MTEFDVNKILGLPKHQQLPVTQATLGHLNKNVTTSNSNLIWVWTDGGCRGNGKPDAIGAWACLLRMNKGSNQYYQREWSEGKHGTTNNQMEMSAVIMALKKLKKSSRVIIHTDSTYVKDGITRWIKAWKQNGWKTKAGSPVKNKELWIEMDDLLKNHTVVFVWTKGHANDKYNNHVDALLNKTMDEMGVLA